MAKICPGAGAPAAPGEPQAVHDDQERAARAALLELPGMGGRRMRALIRHFGSAAEAWRVGPRAWPHAVLAREEAARAWGETWRRLDPQALLAGLRACGIDVVLPGDPGYPPPLRSWDADPPVLFASGRSEAASLPAVAVVGTRRCTPYGRRMAETLAGGVAAAGFAVVSGLALGIDGAAHEAALAAGGTTVAVLGSGLECIYPEQHRDLAGRIRQRGLLLSEHPPHRPPERHHFPLRNRIIARMALAVVIVEAGTRSGALITADLAVQASRPVLAVPGRADSWASAGCLDLIRDGTPMARSVDDVLEALGQAIRVPAPDRGAPAVALTEEERRIYDVVELEGLLVPEDAAARLEWPVQRVWAALTGLELKGMVGRIGSVYVRRRTAGGHSPPAATTGV